MKLMAVGDVSFGRTIGKQDIKHSIPSDITQKLKDADIVFLNLESPLTTATNKQSSHYSKLLETDDRVFLKSDPSNADYLTDMKVTVVSLANNHIMDYQKKGLIDTIDILNKHHIYHVGAGDNITKARSPTILEIGGVLVGFLAYSYTYEATSTSAGAAPLRPLMIKKDIRKLCDNCDIIIVSLHRGEEYCNYSYNREVEICRSFIDEGASIVLCHHPHVLRGIERYNNGLIAYSLGNFIFDSHICDVENNKEMSEKTRESMILELNFEKCSLHDWKIHPLYLNGLGFPTNSSKEKGSIILNNINTYSTNITMKDTSSLNKAKDYGYFTKRLKIFLKIFVKSLYMRNYTNIYLIIMRLLRG